MYDFNILKSNEDKQLVFGWASIVEDIRGDPIADRQGDIISPEDLEDGAYEYVLHFRDTGVEHQSDLRKKGKLVESVVFTREKQRVLGIIDGILPVGWWVGFYISDPATWDEIKSGKLKMFSIQGKGERKAITKSDSVLSFRDVFKAKYI